MWNVHVHVHVHATDELLRSQLRSQLRHLRVDVVEGHDPREQRVQHHAERPQVGGQAVRQLGVHLGRHVRRRAARAARHAGGGGEAPRHAEVGDAQVEEAAPPVDEQHVLRLEIAVDDGVVVECGDAAQGHPRDPTEIVLRVAVLLPVACEHLGTVGCVHAAHVMGMHVR